MLVTWPRALAAGLVVLALAALADPTSACSVLKGDKVLLASQGLDPDVFVWDSSQRLIDYVRGDYDVESVLRHTVLAKPGTTAIATDCRGSVARPKYAKVDIDAVGVKLTKGPNRGHYGWVMAEDVRRLDGKPVTVSVP